MIWELSNPNACKSILTLVILRFCSSSLVTKPLLTARTLSRIFSRRRVTRNCCISWSACNAKVARNCHTGWSRRSALKVVTPTEVRKEGTREDGNKVRIKGAMMWKRCATIWFLDCMTNMRKKKMLMVNGERSIYQDASSSSDGISEGSELPDIISDLITSTRLRNAVRRDWPGLKTEQCQY